jgi:glycosyltransferase involved in cell wall biosynthesis
MKILEVIYSLSSGGGERFVIDLSNELCKENEVYLCTLRKETEENNFYKRELSKKIIYNCLNIKKGIRIKDLLNNYKYIKEVKPDIVHFHLNNISLYFIFSILFFNKSKYFQTIHSDIKNGNYSFLSKFLGSLLFKKIKLITISGEIDKITKKVYSVRNTHLIYNGRSRPLKSSNYSLIKNEIQSLKRTEKDIVFLHIGRFHEQKNQKLLIEAFIQLEREGFNILLLIIGRGFQTKEAQVLLSLAKGKNIKFLGEKMNVADYLEYSDALCLSSLSEGMPISIIEAYACGCPPISTPVSGAIDVIEHGVNGFISKDFSLESYISVIKSFIETRNRINKQDLKNAYHENFTMERCASNYYSVFKSHF